MECKHQKACACPKGDYARLTFRPAGARKNRVVWAIKIGPGKYWRADSEGGLWEDPKAPVNVSRSEMILAPDGKEQAAGVCLIHGELEVL